MSITDQSISLSQQNQVVALIRENASLKYENQRIKDKLQQISTLAQTCLKKSTQLQTRLQNLEQEINDYMNSEIAFLERFESEIERERFQHVLCDSLIIWWGFWTGNALGQRIL